MSKLLYVGSGFMPPFPARDLSEEEVKKYGKKRLLDTGLYKEIKPPKSKVYEPAEMEQEKE